MTNHAYPLTPAVCQLQATNVYFSCHFYDYQEHGGTRASSSSLGIPEHQVIKTLIFEDDCQQPLVILMHGDRRVATRRLADLAGARKIRACAPKVAEQHTGYLVGGTSPFGLHKPLPIFMQDSIADLPLIYINGGQRGFLVGISPVDLLRVLQPALVDVAC